MADSIENLLILLTAVTAVLLAATAARDLLRERRRREYLGRLAGREPAAAPEPDEPEAPLGPVTRRLRAAGLRRLSPLTFFAAAALLAVLTGLALLAIVPATPLAAVAGAALAAYLLWLLVSAWGKRRARRFEERLIGSMAMMVGALKAGENLTQAFASSAEAAEGAVKREFRRVADRLGLGMGIRQALRPIEEGYDSEGTRLFTKTIAAKWQVGGDLAPVLEAVTAVLRDRIRIRWRLHSQLAGARIAVVIAAGVPYLLIPFFLWQRPDWIDRLTGHPWGPRLIFLAVVLQILGLVWMRRVMRVEL